jgi:hypothetical protein
MLWSDRSIASYSVPQAGARTRYIRGRSKQAQKASKTVRNRNGFPSRLRARSPFDKLWGVRQALSPTTGNATSQSNSVWAVGEVAIRSSSGGTYGYAPLKNPGEAWRVRGDVFFRFHLITLSDNGSGLPEMQPPCWRRRRRSLRIVSALRLTDACGLERETQSVIRGFRDIDPPVATTGIEIRARIP